MFCEWPLVVRLGPFLNGLVDCQVGRPGLFVGLEGCTGLFVNGPAATPADGSGITGEASRSAARIKWPVVNLTSTLPVVMEFEDPELVHPIERERGTICVS
jgi:hypothetical protein